MRPATSPRLAPLAADGWDDEGRDLLRGQLTVADRYLTGRPGGPPMPGILGLLGHHPRLAAGWLSFSGGLIDDPVLDPRDRELVVLRVGWRTQCRYEWSQHVRMARGAGLTVEQVAAAAGPVDAPCWDDHQRDLLAAADQLVEAHRIDDATWHRLATRFDERALIELLFVIGSYLCLALVLNSAGLEPDPGTGANGAALPALPALEG